MRVLIAIDVLLVLFFAAQTVSLYHRIDKMKQIKFNQPVYDFAQYRRQAVDMPAALDNLFGLQQVSTSEDAMSKAAGSVVDPGAESVDEIRSGEETLRLRGIFISGNVRNAYISVVGANKPDADATVKLNKYKTGDRIFDLTITAILSDRLILSSSANPQVTLRIYKPLTVTTFNG